MSLTLKIALGVFLGAIAAVLAINAPAWIQQSRREKWHEEAEQAVLGLTPDVLIERCGKPQDDLVDKGNIPARYMYYKGPNAVLTFFKGKELPWQFISMQFDKPTTTNGAIVADGTFIKDAYRQVATMPCLENGVK